MLGFMETPLNHFFNERSDPRTLDALTRGPLAAHLRTYAQQLHDQGYAVSSSRLQLRVLGHFNRWLQSKGLHAANAVSALRSFLRHLLHRGAIDTDLAVCVPTIATWSLSNVPKFLPAEQIQRVLAMPSKRYEKKLVSFLTRPKIDAVLAAPDRNTWAGRRDHTFLLVAVQTGLRLSEMTGLRREDVALGTGAHVHCLGKGRKQRSTPLTKQAASALKLWFQEPMRGEGQIVFPNARGTRLSPDGVQYLLAKHVAVARESCPALNEKRVTPHCLRHTAAMELFQAGVDRSVIALWLGHESVETTQIYLDANLALKEQALAKTTPANVKHTGRYRPDDKLLAFLKSL